MKFKSSIKFFLIVYLFVCPIYVFAEGQASHFTGTYAYEAAPYWPEFEIVRNEDGWKLQVPDSEWSMNLTLSEEKLSGADEDGDVFELVYDAVKKHYNMSRQTQLSTRPGLRQITEKRTLVRLKPSPNDRLEKEYGVTAAELVNAVRDGEDWIHQVKSFQLKAKDTWVVTPEGIENRTRELKEQFPDANNITPQRFAELRPRSEGEFHVFFDESRFRKYDFQKDKDVFLWIWDGEKFIAHEKYFTHDQEHYAFRKEIPQFTHLFVDLMWPRSKAHDFWWEKNRMNNWEDFYGRAKDFILTGKQNFRGTPCYVVECYPKDFRRVRRWFIGVNDHLKYGDVVCEEGQVTWDCWLDDYKQIRPGWWFPMTHGYNVDERDENGDHFIASTRSITVKDVKVDEPLDDELFVMEFKEGIDVNDDRFGGFITYKWKNDRTEAEWEQLRQKAQQRLEEDNAEKRALDERIGQIAPEFSKDGKWLNTEPLSMRDLRGKAVIFQFWGVWCGPCHNYMGLLSTRPQDDPIVVIGVHTPEDDLDGIKEDMDKYQADGPVYVDVGEGWGQLNDWYRVKRRPYWITIRPDGKVLGHFDNPRWALQAAQKSLPESGEEK